MENVMNFYRHIEGDAVETVEIIGAEVYIKQILPFGFTLSVVHDLLPTLLCRAGAVSADCAAKQSDYSRLLKRKQLEQTSLLEILKPFSDLTTPGASDAAREMQLAGIKSAYDFVERACSEGGCDMADFLETVSNAPGHRSAPLSFALQNDGSGSSAVSREYTFCNLEELYFSAIQEALAEKKPFKRCACCGALFLPLRRSDQLYCTFNEKSCAAEADRLHKLMQRKSSPCMRKRRSVYTKLSNRVLDVADEVTRNERQKVFYSFSTEYKIRERLVHDGKMSESEYMEWLCSFDVRRKKNGN